MDLLQRHSDEIRASWPENAEPPPEWHEFSRELANVVMRKNYPRDVYDDMQREDKRPRPEG
jgi:hypothetical protein